MRGTVVGLRIRERRRALGVKQVDLAARLGISPSYLNLIEANKRRIGGSLLTRIAAELDLRLDQLDGTAERRLISTLSEMAADPEVSSSERLSASAENLIATAPDWARLAATTYERLKDAAADAARLSDRLAHDPALATAVHSMLTEISALRSTAEILHEAGAQDEAIDPDQRRRFEAIIFEQSGKLAKSGAALAKYFDDAAERRSDQSAEADAEEALLLLGDASARVETAAAAAGASMSSDGDDIYPALVRAVPAAAADADLGYVGKRDALTLRFVQSDCSAALNRLIDECADAAARAWGAEDAAPALSPDARSSLAEELTRRLADALLFPAAKFAERGARVEWDLRALEQISDGDADLAMRRFAVIAPDALPPGALVAMATVDASGRILRRRGALGMFPRARRLDCPAWPIHSAPRASYAAVPVALREGENLLAIARRDPDGMTASMLLLNAAAAAETIYAPQATGSPRAVGADCRICAHENCALRREPFVARA